MGWRTTWKAEAPIQCRNQKSYPQRHTIGSDLDFDICRVMSTGKLTLTPLFPANNLNAQYTGQCDLKLSFQAKSSEIDSRVIIIRITWDGTWHDGITEMQQRFKIREEP